MSAGGTAPGGIGADIAQPISTVENKWRLLPAFLQVRESPACRH
jgi:hypothetical protein